MDRDEEEIRALVRHWMRATQAGDVSTLTDPMTDEGLDGQRRDSTARMT